MKTRVQQETGRTSSSRLGRRFIKSKAYRLKYSALLILKQLGIGSTRSRYKVYFKLLLRTIAMNDGYEPIEECTVKDVGWMKVSFFDTGLNGFVKHGRAWYLGNGI
ncbi:uncharacterized protein N7458_001808 [Penicillium daleae]|uniref:Uncharacterized protein n=1 Tax=Penicillium daleae TaxID=63821 RepID=A0AAD6CCF0_9EURO|nr:uncharacterized protein N7458_001808 [Penicillium daleae]KAJ5460256.1 hypothetical protein N7458_001808 [Penicillium daleae]